MHPAVSPSYYGYYLDGFSALLGCRFRMPKRGFPFLSNAKSGLALILPRGERIFIAANDSARVDPAAAEWADVIGRVNIEVGETLAPNVLAIGPSFGTRWSSWGRLMGHSFIAGAMTAPS